MSKHARGIFLVVSCGVIFAGGCAKQEIVKKDEPMAPVASAPAAAPAKAEAVLEQPVAKEAIVQAPAAAQESTGASQLQAALHQIYFDFDSYQLSEAARATLAKNGESLKREATAKVRIEGNCDERGSDEYNLALGERRAKAAMAYLTTLGVPAERLTYISYGEEKPAVPGHDEAAWSKNRRDDFVVVTN